jgi:hypothetical protein
VATHNYAGCFGVKPNRSSAAVTKKTPEMYSKARTDHARAMEKIFKYNADKWANDVAYKASKLIDYPTLEGCHIFNGIALGSKKYLEVHIDKDFCYSVVTVFKKEACVVHDITPIAYFCFPRLGIAVREF